MQRCMPGHLTAVGPLPARCLLRQPTLPFPPCLSFPQSLGIVEAATQLVHVSESAYPPKPKPAPRKRKMYEIEVRSYPCPATPELSFLQA